MGFGSHWRVPSTQEASGRPAASINSAYTDPEKNQQENKEKDP